VTIGITYDLRDEYLLRGLGEDDAAEFDTSETIDAIETGLTSLGHQTDRIGCIRNLTARLAAGHRWDIVFNIAEGLNGLSRESQVPALLDAYAITYTFSDPTVLGVTLHKALAKRVVRDIGIDTPDFVVFDTDADLENFRLSFPVFAKPVASGSSLGISRASKIFNADELLCVCRGLRARFRQPVLVETFLSGREFTVGIVGTGRSTRVLGALEILLQQAAEPDIYSYANKRDYQRLVRYRLAEDAVALQVSELALRVWTGLGCRDAGRVDIRLDECGKPNFLEVNPLAGLHPEHSDLMITCRLLEISFMELLNSILESAQERRSGQRTMEKRPLVPTLRCA
jgi:D-alanine-D-alanine ligase